MNKRIEVGYICTKGGGHASLAGESDHGTCGSHIGGRIYIEDEDDGMFIDLEEQAEKLETWVKRAEQAIHAQYWANHSDEQ